MPPKKHHDIKPVPFKTGTQQPTTVAASPTAPTMGLTNYAEAQQEELEVLRSIYMDDFEEIERKQAAWNVGLCWEISRVAPADLS